MAVRLHINLIAIFKLYMSLFYVDCNVMHNYLQYGKYFQKYVPFLNLMEGKQQAAVIS